MLSIFQTCLPSLTVYGQQVRGNAGAVVRKSRRVHVEGRGPRECRKLARLVNRKAINAETRKPGNAIRLWRPTMGPPVSLRQALGLEPVETASFDQNFQGGARAGEST